MKRAIVLGCLLSCSAFGQMNMKPGLWETTSAAPGGARPGGIPPEALARMTPEQQQRVAAAMAARGGVSAAASQPTVSKSCITAEQLSKPMTFGQDQPGCKVSVVSSSRSRQEIAMSCERPEFKSTGTLVIEAQDPEHYTGVLKIQADITSGSGRGPMSMDRKFTGKWVSSDCGDVKPHEAK
jgi:hypothetical protein